MVPSLFKSTPATLIKISRRSVYSPTVALAASILSLSETSSKTGISRELPFSSSSSIKSSVCSTPAKTRCPSLKNFLHNAAPSPISAPDTNTSIASASIRVQTGRRTDSVQQPRFHQSLFKHCSTACSAIPFPFSPADPPAAAPGPYLHKGTYHGRRSVPGP